MVVTVKLCELDIDIPFVLPWLRIPLSTATFRTAQDFDFGFVVWVEVDFW